ncbi:MAG TPA: GTP 3',8-cyclase MoaA [Sphingobacteriaceae bacterium]
MIRDSHNRLHNYLRISLTDNCNLRCFYCMPDESYAFTPASGLMQLSEIEAIAGIFVKEGVNKIRLTGGEPLVRKDAAEIIRALAKLPVELTLTTNGTRLHQFTDVLREAGVRSVNISLDTLQDEKFTRITRRPQFALVMSNIQRLLALDFHVKLNVVVMKGLNEDEINDFVEWTRLAPVHVRFIEFMPFSGNRWTSNQVVTLGQILQTIGEKYRYLPLQRENHETAKKFRVPGHAGTFAVISTMSSHFCGDCNRLRLTADGKLKNCLFSKEETDLLSAYRKDGDLLQLIHENVQGKALQLGGQLVPDFESLPADRIENRSMITIGG